MNLSQLINDTQNLGIKVLFGNLPVSLGRHLKIDNQKIIIVHHDLSDKETAQVILHERGHFINNHSYIKLASSAHHYKQEFEAEKSRIEFDLHYYITNTPKEYWNTFNFIDYFGLDSHYEDYINDSFRQFTNKAD